MTELTHDYDVLRPRSRAAAWFADLAQITKSFEQAFEAARLAEQSVYVSDEALESRGLTRDDLMREMGDVICGRR